jgi:hypothetical protein
MTIIELEAHRHTITTPHGPVSCIDVGSGPVALFVHGLGTNALLWRHIIRAFARLKSLIPGASEVIEIDGGRLFFPEERPADLIDALHKHWAR